MRLAKAHGAINRSVSLLTPPKTLWLQLQSFIDESVRSK